jgi:hypothetical protein
LAESDGDGLDDGDEVDLGTSPLARDSDDDGLEDGVDPEPTVPIDQAPAENDNAEPEPDNDNADEGPLQIEEAEPNDTFAEATAAGLGEADAMTLVGAIGASGDVDIFDLGAFQAGDRLTAVVLEAGGFFELVGAAFDDTEGIVSHTDDLIEADAVGGVLLDAVIRHDSPRYYLAVTHDDVLAEPGDYQIELAVERGGEVPQPAGQIVYLNFAGGTVNDPTVGETELGPFDAADVDPQFEDDTGTIKSVIIQTVRGDFEGYDLTLLESDTDEKPTDDPFTVVYFGGFSRPDFSVSDGFDPYNSNPSDRAIIYTGSFSPDAYSSEVDAAAVGSAIGNRVSYELGLMLGLRQVEPDEDVMQDAADGDSLLQDRAFGTSSLAEQVFPVGQQDAARLLSEILGSD